VDATLAAFGRIDYLINNAGVSGAEEMAVDMSLDAWTRTLDANLVSNYVLMHEVLPLMKRQGSGYVLNVSELLRRREVPGRGLPQPQRLRGQQGRAARDGRDHGALPRPEVQVNAIAPGPVEGERLKGTGSRPGPVRAPRPADPGEQAAQRRACGGRQGVARGERVEALLAQLATNDVPALAMDKRSDARAARDWPWPATRSAATTAAGAPTC
jgi:malonyl-CoA reductase / 3-hydroxypropionate dehydrogenase (NADP+)